ncbi:MAG: TonB-dependent receptor [Bacteroidota bacterium]
MKTVYLFILWALCLYMLRAQESETLFLDEVTVSDVQLKYYADGHKQKVLRDSVLQRNGISLTSLLAFNSNLYLKENGFGMVASPSFRGTNASHTAVVWNGININSQLNGQVDFNTINPLNYDAVNIRSGGGSVQYGSGAIGGSVHLNNELQFNQPMAHQVFSGYGSFNTQTMNYKNDWGNEKLSSSVGVNYNRSDNDYEYLGTDRQNENGDFENLNVNISMGYRFKERQALRLYHQSFLGDRNLSGTLVAPGRSRYKDDHHRTQLEWLRFGAKTVGRLKVAHLYEAFQYFENTNADFFSEGRLTTLVAHYSMDTQLSKTLRLHSFLTYYNYAAQGDSFGSPNRNDLGFTAIVKHHWTDKMRHNLSVRQDFSSDFSSPLVFAWSASYDLTKRYQLQWNCSRNFRMPTFNDLYWQPGGNLELTPERSYQFDLGHQWEINNFSLQCNTYYITTEDMIRWLPTVAGPWSPINVDEVQIYGAELSLAYKKNIGKQQEIELNTNYAYTVSRDRATKAQLIYVPLHSANASVAYRFGPFAVFYQQLYNGEVSIIGGTLEDYDVANLGLTYALQPKGKLHYRIGLTLNNVFNTYYENVALRPMPNRHLQTQLVLNF